MTDTYRFRVLGPFRVPTTIVRRRRKIDFSRARDVVFEQAHEVCGETCDISTAVGCYVFGLSPPGGPRTRPYYVGQSRGQTLYARTFQKGDKPAVYNAILGQYERAAPFMFLLPLFTPSGRLAKLHSNKHRIDLAEHTLIGAALRANPDLWNIKHRVAMEAFTIDGTPGGSARSRASRAFAAMLNREPPKKVKTTKGELLESPDVRDPDEPSLPDMAEDLTPPTSG